MIRLQGASVVNLLGKPIWFGLEFFKLQLPPPVLAAPEENVRRTKHRHEQVSRGGKI